MTVRVIHGDMREQLRVLRDDGVRVHSIVTDPPYHLTSIVKRFANADAERETFAATNPTKAYASLSRGFMGKAWDGGDIAFQAATWRLCFDLLPPGGFLVAFGGSRTFHRLVCAIEDAGFEIRDSVAWITGAGFPKSRNISADLRSLPTCSCGIAEVEGDRGAIVDASLPASLVGASVGAEAGAVPLARNAACETSGLSSESSPAALRREPVVQRGVEDGSGHLDPIMLGTLGMTGPTKREQIVEAVSGIKTNPKALRDQMVGDEAVSGTAVGASTVASNGSGSAVSPTSTLVLPFPATPSGISGSALDGSVTDSHTGFRTIDAGLASTSGIGAKDIVAGSADPSFHGPAFTTKSALKVRCEQCGKVVRDAIPDGLGSALKPALELICLARKPLSGTLAANVLKHGTGALNIDGCRIGTEQRVNAPAASTGNVRIFESAGRIDALPQEAIGRWPANVCHDGSDEVVKAFPETQSGALNTANITAPNNIFGSRPKELNGEYQPDSGSAARFFYSSKADADDRLGSKHPTVKPVDLMRWLVRLVTPPGSTVLDPFAGSGTTGMACMAEGLDCILIEREAEYVADIEARIAHVHGDDTPLFKMAAD